MDKVSKEEERARAGDTPRANIEDFDGDNHLVANSGHGARGGINTLLGDKIGGGQGTDGQEGKEESRGEEFHPLQASVSPNKRGKHFGINKMK